MITWPRCIIAYQKTCLRVENRGSVLHVFGPCNVGWDGVGWGCSRSLFLHTWSMPRHTYFIRAVSHSRCFAKHGLGVVWAVGMFTFLERNPNVLITCYLVFNTSLRSGNNHMFSNWNEMLPGRTAFRSYTNLCFFHNESLIFSLETPQKRYGFRGFSEDGIKISLWWNNDFLTTPNSNVAKKTCHPTSASLENAAFPCMTFKQWCSKTTKRYPGLRAVHKNMIILHMISKGLIVSYIWVWASCIVSQSGNASCRRSR